MKCDEDCAAMCIGHSSSVVKGRILVALARKYGVESQPFQFRSHDARQPKNDILLDCAADSTRAKVGAAMAGIEHNNGEPVLRRLGFSLRRCS
jgi:hypothetical protein